MLDEEIINRLEDLSSTLLADVMNYENVMDCKIKPINYKKKLVGQARTISVYPGDNLYIHYGIYEADPGEILVVDGKDSEVSAYIGNLMAAAAEQLGIKGIVIDGLVRDKRELEEMDIQIYAKGLYSKGPRKNGPGSMDETIQCGGVVVNSSDFIVGDEDGVLVIPYKKAEEFIVKAENKKNYEIERLNTIQNFKNDINSDKSTIEPKWLRQSLESNT
ncbi:RraA family protein [Mammaliicoccus sciuri]|uniref:RraA family protein n=1 Tax=Mammaliicoccus sciuri TaxID=1296 RepID=UPI001FB2C7ED|nr:RraA family protein [Mammaliicoccus sciuri]MCJ0920085.1 RraA family protein [Mammaliicoccus sciuri]MCJ0957784.1 RraA family protein [Mammaliicoccus sciuri]MCJ0962819.1 RraA family protein [Mammaliicoccus sciuri]MCJ1776633.1 RraA family protein [Mammaliicoccus sciuri]MDC5693711.1 RraA family protein [Mammaliicoccus sciuri]